MFAECFNVFGFYFKIYFWKYLNIRLDMVDWKMFKAVTTMFVVFFILLSFCFGLILTLLLLVGHCVRIHFLATNPNILSA